jgi:hypothetical protein
MGSITKLRPGKYPKKKKWGWEIDDIIIAPSGAEYECIDSEPYYLERFDKYCTLLIPQKANLCRGLTVLIVGLSTLQAS